MQDGITAGRTPEDALASRTMPMITARCRLLRACYSSNVYYGVWFDLGNLSSVLSH